MKNNIILTLAFLLVSLSLWSQSKTGTTRAVVIGISDYQDPLIPDLQFAHKDAIAFADWLRSPAGGEIAEENLLLHTNKAATNAEMIMSLHWLIEESKAGDRAFIYFSGHGDVERVTKYNNGYLLGYDSPPAVYAAGAFAVDYLKDIIATLSDNEVQVFLISDACRAGKLAGSSKNGSQVTASRLSQQFANEIKVLSCQPDEFSIEGKQWGGGRGVFSYHLENALYGFADQNDDLQINLMELRRYLQDKVSAEADPESQIPMIQGPPKERIAFVNNDVLAQRREELGTSNPEFLAIHNRGLEEMILADLDTNLQIVYQQFLTAIDSNFLMTPEGSSANDYYETLMASVEMERLHATVKRKFVVALMDEGQQIINKVMRTDPQMLDNIHARRIIYDHLPNYYKRASEILGKEHYFYHILQAKELYFRAKSIRRTNNSNLNYKERRGKKIDLLKNALSLDSTLALLYFELSRQLGFDSPESLKNLNESTLRAPNWALGHYMLGWLYFDFGEIDKAIATQKKAIELDSNFLSPYIRLGDIYLMIKGDQDSSNIFYSLFLEKQLKKPDQLTSYNYCDLGNAFLQINKYDKALDFLLKGQKLSNNQNYGIRQRLGWLYVNTMQYQKGIKEIEYMNNGMGLSLKGEIYYQYLHNFEKADSLFSKLIDFKESTLNPIRKLHYLFQSGDYYSTIRLAETCIKFPDYFLAPDIIYGLYAAESYRLLGMNKKANEWYQLTIDSTNIELNRAAILCPDYVGKAICLHRLGKIDEFKNLIDRLKLKHSDYPKFYYNLALIYSNIDQKDTAICQLKQAVKMGWEPFQLIFLEGTLCYPLLDPIRESPEYFDFVQQHFPQYLDVATKLPPKRKKK